MRFLFALFVTVFCLTACTGAQRDRLVERVIDCTTDSATKMIDEFRPVVVDVINGARTASGAFDYDAATDRLKTMGIETGACVVADVVGAVLSGRRGALGVEVSQMEAHAFWDAMRGRYWPRATYKTAAGTL